MDIETLGREVAALRVYIEDTRRELEIRVAGDVQLRFEQRRAIDIVQENLNRRLEGMNEFREQLSAQANTFMTKEAAEQLWANHNRSSTRTEERLRHQEQAMANITGKLVVVGGIITAVMGSISIGLRFV